MIDDPEVLCVGVATWDTIAVVDRLPGDDERIVARTLTTGGGGPAATAAVAMARLGVSVGFCGVVGADETGELIRAGLAAEGVDVRRLRSEPGTESVRSLNLVVAATGSRSIVTMPSSPPPAAAIPVGRVRWLHVDQTGYPAARAALAESGGSLLSVDAGNPIPGLTLAGIDLFVPTATALERVLPGADLAGRMRSAVAAGAGDVVVTAGGDGSYVLVPGSDHGPGLGAAEIVRIAPHPVQVVSTIGAGDVYHGALVAGLVDGLDLVEAARQASVAAALSCRALDGRSAIPDLAETRAALAAQRTTSRG